MKWLYRGKFCFVLWPSFSPLLIFILRSFCCYRGCASRVIIAKVSTIPSTIPANPRPVCNIRSGQVVRAGQGPIPGPGLAAELIPGKLERRARNVNEDPSLVILSGPAVIIIWQRAAECGASQLMLSHSLLWCQYWQDQAIMGWVGCWA